jgi:hypothetical protein
MKFKFLVVNLVLSMLFIIQGCLPTPTPTQPPTCSPTELQAPSLAAPPDWVVVPPGTSLPFPLAWYYPLTPSTYYYGSSVCLPENYRVFLSAYDNITGGMIGLNLGDDTTFPVTSNLNALGTWTPAASSLLPGTWYAWNAKLTRS